MISAVQIPPSQLGVKPNIPRQNIESKCSSTVNCGGFMRFFRWLHSRQYPLVETVRILWRSVVVSQ